MLPLREFVRYVTARYVYHKPALLQQRSTQQNRKPQIGAIGERKLCFEGLTKQHQRRADDKPPLHIAERIADFALFKLGKSQNMPVMLGVAVVEKPYLQHRTRRERVVLNALMRTVQRRSKSPGIDFRFYSIELKGRKIDQLLPPHDALIRR